MALGRLARTLANGNTKITKEITNIESLITKTRILTHQLSDGYIRHIDVCRTWQIFDGELHYFFTTEPHVKLKRVLEMMNNNIKEGRLVGLPMEQAQYFLIEH